MVAKRKDFQKTALHIHELLLKLGDEPDCSELRDSLNLSLLHMQRYFQVLRQRRRLGSGEYGGSASSTMGEGSLTGFSPVSPYHDKSDKFVWHWRRNRTSQDSHYQEAHFRHSSSDSIHNMEENLNPVLRTIQDGHMQAMIALCQQDQNHLKECDAFERTVVMYAVKYEQMEALEWLLDQGANVNAASYDGSTALMIACYYGYSDATELLLSYGANVNAQDNMGRAPIHWACVVDQYDCLKCLIKYGVNVNIRDADGLTPAMWSCYGDKIEHFRLLSEVENQKIDEPDGIERDNYGRTWMHWAVRRSEPLECLATLLTVETAVLRDDHGKTVMLLAAEIGSLAACRVIVDIVGNDCIHDRDDQDRTPLHLATLGGYGEVVNFLIERGGDLEARDKNNCTPWTFANNRHLHYCKLIISSHYRQRSRSVDSRASTQTNSTANYGWESEWKPRTPPRPPKSPPLKIERSPTLRRSLKRNTEATVPSSGVDPNQQGHSNHDRQTPESVDNHMYSQTHHKPDDRQRDMEDGIAYERGNEDGPTSPAYSSPHQGHSAQRLSHTSSSEKMVSNDWNDQEIPPSHAKVLVIHPSSAESRSHEDYDNEEYSRSPVYSRDSAEPHEPSSGRAHISNMLSRVQPPPRLQSTHQTEEFHPWNESSSANRSAPESHNDRKPVGRVPRPRQRQGVSHASSMDVDQAPEKVDQQKPPETPPELRRRPAVPAQLIPLEALPHNRSTSEDRNRHGAGTLKKNNKKRKAPIMTASSDEFIETTQLGGSAWTNTFHSSSDKERAVIEETVYPTVQVGDEGSRKSTAVIPLSRQARILQPPSMSLSPRNLEPSGPPVLNPQGPGHTRQSQLLSYASSNNASHDPLKGPIPPMAPGPMDSLRNSVASWNSTNGNSTPRSTPRNDVSPRNHLPDHEVTEKNAVSLPPALHPRPNKRETSSGHKSNDSLFGFHHHHPPPVHSQLANYSSYHG